MFKITFHILTVVCFRDVDPRQSIRRQQGVCLLFGTGLDIYVGVCVLCVCVQTRIWDFWVVAVCFTGTAAAANALECVRPANFTQSSLSEISHFFSTSIGSSFVRVEFWGRDISVRAAFIDSFTERANGIAC